MDGDQSGTTQMPGDDTVPLVGLEELEEPEGHYLLVVNGRTVNAEVVLTPRDFEQLATYVDELRD